MNLFKRTRSRLPWSDTMGLLLLMWLCTLPLIGLVVVPAFGMQVGLGVAAGSLFAVLVLCWVLCRPRSHR